MVNCRLKQIATLHNALHGFRAERGTGIVTSEVNFVQQLAGIAHKLPFQVFLDKPVRRRWCGGAAPPARLAANFFYK